MDTPEQPTNSAAASANPSRTRHRSPNYPGVGLRGAVAKIQTLYKADGLAASPKDAALKHFGYTNPHGEAGRLISALKSFGLIEEINDRIKLSQRGVDIVVRPEGDPQRTAALQTAAVSPPIYAELLKEYKTGLPSDTTLKAELIAVKRFNPKAVDEFVRDFRDSVKFANISDPNVVDSLVAKIEENEAGSEDDSIPEIGDLVQWESQGVLCLPQPRRLRALSEDGLWAFLEGSDTGVPVKELIMVEAPAEPTIEKPPVVVPEVKKPGDLLKRLPVMPAPPKMRSYTWALSGDFSAKLELFGEAESVDDLDALIDYVEITVKALKRSLKASVQATTSADPSS